MNIKIIKKKKHNKNNIKIDLWRLYVYQIMIHLFYVFALSIVAMVEKCFYRFTISEHAASRFCKKKHKYYSMKFIVCSNTTLQIKCKEDVWWAKKKIKNEESWQFMINWNQLMWTTKNIFPLIVVDKLKHLHLVWFVYKMRLKTTFEICLMFNNNFSFSRLKS